MGHRLEPGDVAVITIDIDSMIELGPTAPGAVKFLIKAKGKKRKTLNEAGKVKLKPKITFTPTGGDPSTQSTKLKLKKG